MRNECVYQIDQFYISTYYNVDEKYEEYHLKKKKI